MIDFNDCWFIAETAEAFYIEEVSTGDVVEVMKTLIVANLSSPEEINSAFNDVRSLPRSLMPLGHA